MTGDSYATFFLLAFAAVVIYVIGFKDGQRQNKELGDAIDSAADSLSKATAAVKTATAAADAVAQAAPAFDPPVALGQRFTYLGIEMLCIGHFMVMPPFGQVLQGVRAEYVDRDGRLQGAAFPAHDMDSLRAELARAVVPTGEPA